MPFQSMWTGRPRPQAGRRGCPRPVAPVGPVARRNRSVPRAARAPARQAPGTLLDAACVIAADRSVAAGRANTRDRGPGRIDVHGGAEPLGVLSHRALRRRGRGAETRCAVTHAAGADHVQAGLTMPTVRESGRARRKQCRGSRRGWRRCRRPRGPSRAAPRSARCPTVPRRRRRPAPAGRRRCAAPPRHAAKPAVTATARSAIIRMTSGSDTPRRSQRCAAAQSCSVLEEDRRRERHALRVGASLRGVLAHAIEVNLDAARQRLSGDGTAVLRDVEPDR